MTLRGLRTSYPTRFHPNQDWFENEPFMDFEVGAARYPGCWKAWPRFRQADTPDGLLYHAAELFELYLMGNNDSLWQNYLWTADVDSHGQRVYVGDNGKGFEIHRHIHISARFGYPVWQ